jgi:ribonuclease P protein component
MSETHLPTKHAQAGEEPRLPPPHVDTSGTGHPPGAPPQGPPPPGELSGHRVAPADPSPPQAGIAGRSRIWRIRDRRTFAALRGSGRYLRQGPITVTFLSGDPGTPPRFAYAVGRRVGTAVARNRLRRRLRAAVATASALRSGAYLVGAGPEAARLSFGELRKTLCEALEAVARLPDRQRP